MELSVKYPYGTGYAVVTGDYSPPILTNSFCAWEDSEEPCEGSFEVSSFKVGGVDILDELVDTYEKALVKNPSNNIVTTIWKDKWEKICDNLFNLVEIEFLQQSYNEAVERERDFEELYAEEY